MQGLTTLDFQILHAIQRIFSCSVLDFLMPKITALGNGGILWILLAILLLILPKTRKNGIQLGVGCVGCGRGNGKKYFYENRFPFRCI